MASESDGRTSPGFTFSSMKQPPLIKQLKGILSEYPDGGQILKEVIQNAEDADASEVKIVYDGRRINDTTSETALGYNRFFKGPALCIYNDGVFAEKDWDGIRMIYSSVKEDDPLTVGRFGLGFKSVFHITDYPCVISGSKMLLIDPQQPSDKVNAMINLSRIDQVEDEGLNAETFWSALEGAFGFNRECARAGNFHGTIFWFPLREKPSEISETLYDQAKVMDLFDGFQSEASSILLFLKNLRRISVSVVEADKQFKEIAKTEVDDNAGKLKQSRAKFKEKITLLSSDYRGEDIAVDLQMTIRTTINSVCETAQWQVVNYFVGNSASTEFKKLIQDDNLGYSPYIGVAAPLSLSKDTFEGHVFCFLPLPREGSRLTGLPVHVNGFFALSQNRHHLKWETDEQKGKKIDDKNILWNKSLINEALPKAYSRLVQAIVEVSTYRGNDDESVAMVYNCLPLASNIQNKWKALETELYKRIKKSKILYSKYKNRWVTISDACFASFDKLSDDYKHTAAAVVRCLNLLGKIHVDLPSHTLNNLRRHFQSVKDLSPDTLAKLLRQNAAYKNLSNSDKIDLLTYLFSDERYYEKIEGLELLPLASERWTSYNTQRDPVYICSDEEVDILKGSEHMLIRKALSLGKLLSYHIEQLCKKGLFQIKKMETSILEHFLEITIADQLGTSLCITQNTKVSFGWLKDVWKYVLERNCIPQFRNVHIVPALTKGTWDEPEAAELETLSGTFLVKSSMQEELPDGVCRCFGNVGVRVLGSLPDWIPREKVKSFFFWPTKKSFCALLSKLGSGNRVKETIEIFNSTCQGKDRSAFLACLARCHQNLTEDATEFTKSLKLFLAINSIADKGTPSSVSETRCYIMKTEGFPEGVQFPFKCLEADPSQEVLLTQLGARKIDLQEISLATLDGFQKKGFKNTDEIPKFMSYFISKFYLFQTNQDIINAASEVPFLKAGSHRCKAADLFDPSDTFVKDLLIGDALTPETKKPLNSETIRTLKFLGLKSFEDITADIVFQVARTLDIWSKETTDRAQCLKKAESMMKLLHSRQTLLNEKCLNGLTLADNLKTLSCIPVQCCRPPTYPRCVQWFSENGVLCKPLEAKEACVGLIVGATVPIVASASENMNKEFGWTRPPPILDVISQLEIIKGSYSVQNRPDIMPLIKAIYSHLALRCREIWKNSQDIQNKNVIWNGEEFVAPNRVIVSKSIGDLDLQPYFCFVPAEFAKMQQLFSAFGCPLTQDTHILVETLQQIKELHCTIQDEQTVTRDRNIVCNILDKIARKVMQNGLSIDEYQIQMMVHDDNNSKSLCLLPIAECVYDDDPTFFFDNDENVHLVHEMVSKNTVEALGIKSVTRKALMEAEELGFEQWGQQEPLTTRIHALLRDGYTDGLSVPKELIQNADDAGASVVKFLYDERQNTDFKQRVFSKEMRDFQGPALWIFNDARFSVEDLKNITKLNAATKQTDMRKIGKFGLGFCSVYNLTDLPSFLSGSSLVFFDPHEKHISNVLRSKGTGLKYRLPNKTLVLRHIDQFMPYAGIFGCDIEQESFQEYDGTLFRLPLRTEQQARESHICTVSYTKEEMTKLLQMFIETAGNCLLFTQNVKEVEIHHISDKASSVSDQKLLYRIKKGNVKWSHGVQEPVRESVLSRMPQLLEKQNDFLELHKSVIRQTLTDNAKKIIGDFNDDVTSSETAWLTSWAKGDGKSLKMYKTLSSEGAVPLSAVSVPCSDSDVLECLDLKKVPSGFYSEGHVFCFLPLPLKTKLQLHINGCFAVTSDRRQLASLTEDDKNSQGNAWNVALMEDSLVNAHLQLIQTLANSNMKTQANYRYYELWPSMCATLALPFKNSFYKAVIKQDIKVFRGNETWVSFHDAVFLDPKLRGSNYGELAFEVLLHFQPRQGKTLIEMPDHIIENIMQSNRDKENSIRSAQICEKDFFLTFLNTLHTDFWIGRSTDRNMLILAALKSQYLEVKQEMRTLRCIPTEPDNGLSRASDLIHPHSPIASLFCDKEKIFPLCTKDFRKESILAKLVELGMSVYSLLSGLLLDRCVSISTLAEKCDSCAKERCINVIRYISQDHVLNELGKDKYILEQISDQYMLPILSKPKDWRFSWKSESDVSQVKSYNGQINCEKHRGEMEGFLLGKSKQLYRQNMKDYIGTVGVLVDENYTLPLKEYIKNRSKLLKLLGIKSLEETSLKMLVQQLKEVSKEYKDKTTQFADVSRIHENVFLHLEKKLKSSEMAEAEKKVLDSLRNYPVVLVSGELVRVQRVAFDVKVEYKPYLYRLPEMDRFNKNAVYSYLGVQEYFSLEVIIEAMKKIKQSGRMMENVETVNNLLINLDEVMQKTGRSYEDIAEYHEDILAPDIDCNLLPTYQLVIENEDFSTSKSMKILHQSIAPMLAQNLGVKVKQLQCFEEIYVGISFGQREKLVTRIKGLLKAYPCDSSIMKELLQNADDAGATEIHFVKDYRTHSTDKLFQSSCDILQSPSLCVYNNSYFTQKDIEGIHNLGQGSKSDDPTKTGQYGVGFNAVYHLTDTPSFVTVGPDTDDGGLLFILDPLCKHVPKATAIEPGMMCSLKDLESNFSDHVVGFSLGDLMQGDVGTVFRFPLRSIPSEISNEKIPISKMDDILHSFQADMFECVLFLKNINCIRVSNITSGTLVEEYTVKVELSDKAKRERSLFNKTVDEITKLNMDNRAANLEVTPREVVYQLTVRDNKSCFKHWEIIQRFGIYGPVEQLDEIKRSLNSGDLGFLPLGGVAIPLSGGFVIDFTETDAQTPTNDRNTDSAKAPKEGNADTIREKPFTGKLFCFLPLPVKTGLPVHVNGHFALDHEARRDLWKDGYRQKWNSCVVNAVIIPAWISGLLHIRNLITPIMKSSKSRRALNTVLDEFHSHFPVQKCTSDFWNSLVEHFYTYIMQEHIAVFSCVLDTECKKEALAITACVSNGERFSTIWTDINATPDGIFYGIFNTVIDEMRQKHYVQQKDIYLIIKLLKSFGMKLLDTPNEIRLAMETSGIKGVLTSAPSQVVSFMKTFADTRDSSCTIGPLDSHILETRFASSNNLNVLLSYIMLDNDFQRHMKGLPILLTADDIVRVCSENSPVFISRYSKLLSKSAHLFVHEDIRFSFRDPKCFETNIFKQFQFEDFVRLLPDNLDIDVYGNGSTIKLKKDEEENDRAISDQWLTLLYDFLCEYSSQSSHENMMLPRIDTERLIRNISMLDKWSFLPCLRKNNYFLIPFTDRVHVLFLSSLEKICDVGKSLKIFHLPTIYGEAFAQCRQKEEIRKSMENIVASISRPYDLLQCLVHYKNELETNTTKTEDDGIEILSFFGRNMKVLQKCGESNTIIQYLRQLPLYITQQGTMIDITGTKEVLVLPKGMPFGGIHAWAETCNVTLLQEKESLVTLYEFLGLQKADAEYVYGHKILPRFDAIPNQHWMEHIEYLRDSIGHKPSVSEQQLKIIKELKRIAFINVNGVMKKANQLFDPTNKVFKHMVDSCDSLPSELLTSEWRQFLTKLDLKCKVTDEMMVQFARQIESESTHIQPESLHKKSSGLLSKFCKDRGTNWNILTISQIRTIKFIQPYTIERENTDVCQQFGDTDRLICFYDAVSSTHSSLCWSSINLLSHELCLTIDKDVRKQLGIHEQPPVDKVMIHCENVCSSLKHKMSNNTVSGNFVKKQMSNFYEFFGNLKSLGDQVISTIQKKPFIHLPEDNEIVFLSEVVIDMQPTLEIKPYLYRAPTYYGKYFDLFRMIGCKSKVMFCHYASVLHKIKDICKENEMNLPERAVVKRAFEGLINLKVDTDESTHDVQAVFLPTQKMTLKASRDVIVSNEVLFELRLRGNIELDLCAGESFLNTKRFSLEDVFSGWPDHLKPSLLTDIVKEEVCLEGVARKITNSSKVSQIEAFLRSRELVTALCRLIKHQCTDGTSQIKFDGEGTESEITANLQMITVVEFPALRTVLKYQGNVVPGSEREINHYIKKHNEDPLHPISFYFNDASNTQKLDIPSILHGMISLLKMCASGLNADSIVHVTLLIQALETPQQIPVILDHLQIKQFGASQKDYFPKPGTYVEPHFIPFLVQGICPFKEYEYEHVAMELEDCSLETEDDSGRNPVFIYVKILREVIDINSGNYDLRRTYIVETGNKDIPSERVPIYRLYRFMRKEMSSSEEIEVYTGEQRDHQIPVDEQCKKIRKELEQAWRLPEIDRKRVIRRIFLQWHPDKNRGNEEYCTKVFQYIQVILSRLENGEKLVDDVQEEMSRGKSQFSQSSSAFYENVFRRARSYARAYYDNFDAYNRSERTGSYAHFSAPACKRPDHGEAQRWFRQAKNDFLAATEMLQSADSVSSFNWVCYICHQACEKALKSAHYSKDANKIPGGIFLPALASTPEMTEQANLLETRLGEHGRLRYPDPLSRPRIPSDMFNKDDAEFSLTVARKILELVEEYI